MEEVKQLAFDTLMLAKAAPPAEATTDATMAASPVITPKEEIPFIPEYDSPSPSVLSSPQVDVRVEQAQLASSPMAVPFALGENSALPPPALEAETSILTARSDQVKAEGMDTESTPVTADVSALDASLGQRVAEAIALGHGDPPAKKIRNDSAPPRSTTRTTPRLRIGHKAFA